ncbi:hypothetical protein SAMN04244573_03061 [Azotobacter beijerinckii]|uniref:Uncharacterized protein n=1 Tax=Azotobacter beijerinckii TaxID=170623 RepID=A0A1H9M5R0_9GAMM|nr:hypothetical protein [Azotobacter beijerinckii]SER19090.1 hypothetical protein SAMN04244573_03061 [Azotobacter beijerinckii]
MTLLAELFELLESEPEKSGICNEMTGKPIASANAVKVAALAPAINDHQTAPEPLRATAEEPAVPIPTPAAERPAEARRNAWTITRGGKPICTMVGELSTRTEALAEARWRWPDADILES